VFSRFGEFVVGAYGSKSDTDIRKILTTVFSVAKHGHSASHR
jgi:hypothetical protein